MPRRFLKIFLTYAREDREPVESVYERLKEEGFEPWMDVKKIVPGDNWNLEIENAIRESDVVLVFFSTKSIN